jgi:excisionase family DNA binding protein
MSNKIIQNNFYTTIELAKELGISKVSVLKRIWRGNIKAIKMGRNFIIFKKDVNIKKLMLELQK